MPLSFSIVGLLSAEVTLLINAASPNIFVLDDFFFYFLYRVLRNLFKHNLKIFLRAKILFEGFTAGFFHCICRIAFTKPHNINTRSVVLDRVFPVFQDVFDELSGTGIDFIRPEQEAI